MFRRLIESVRNRFLDEKELADDCGMWGMFIEYRHYDPDKGICTDNAKDDERIVYDVICFCGMIDSDGLQCLLSQPENKLALISQSCLKLGLVQLVENT